MWARLLSSTNQPSFLRDKDVTEDKDDEEVSNRQNPDGAVDPDVQGKPMRFIYKDDNDKLNINPELVDALEHIKGPNGVVSFTHLLQPPTEIFQQANENKYSF